MAHNFEVIDADGHITEEDNQLKQYMDARYRDRAATLTPRDSWDRSLGGTLGTRARDARSWLDAMDRGGVSTGSFIPPMVSASVGSASLMWRWLIPRHGTTLFRKSFRR